MLHACVLSTNQKEQKMQNQKKECTYYHDKYFKSKTTPNYLFHFCASSFVLNWQDGLKKIRG